jgi:hypothetical protein
MISSPTWLYRDIENLDFDSITAIMKIRELVVVVSSDFSDANLWSLATADEAFFHIPIRLHPS